MLQVEILLEHIALVRSPMHMFCALEFTLIHELIKCFAVWFHVNTINLSNCTENIILMMMNRESLMRQCGEFLWWEIKLDSFLENFVYDLIYHFI